MLHARKDYAAIQDTRKKPKIGKEEPVFLLRAKDCLSAKAVFAWAAMLREMANHLIPGEDSENMIAYARGAEEQAQAMAQWQKDNSSRVGVPGI